MKRQIRVGVFETNSSSTHSMTIFTREQYDKYCNGELYINESWHEDNLPDLVTAEELRKVYPLTEKEKQYFDTEEEYWSDLGFRNHKYEDYYLESDVNYYTTPGGEEIVICCEYGYDS